MSRNLCETRCCFCGWRPTLIEQPRPITNDEAGGYFDEFAGMLVANADCEQCGAKYLAWVDERPRKPMRVGGRLYVFEQHGWELGDFFDLSFRSTFNDEPGDDDMPTRPFGSEVAAEQAKLVARAETAEAEILELRTEARSTWELLESHPRATKAALAKLKDMWKPLGPGLRERLAALAAEPEETP